MDIANLTGFVQTKPHNRSSSCLFLGTNIRSNKIPIHVKKTLVSLREKVCSGLISPIEEINFDTIYYIVIAYTSSI